MNARDKDVLLHILRYCEEIEEAKDYFSEAKDIFLSNSVYRNAVSMPMQQIGELAKNLTDEFIEEHSNIPWKNIKGMRTWFAHQYHRMDPDIIWEVMHDNIPGLESFCRDVLFQAEVKR